jgi:hypothetical protein
MAMPAMSASRMPVVMSRTAVWTAVCFARRKPASSERRSRLCGALHNRDYAERTVMRSWRSPMKGPAIFCGVMLYIILPFGWFP